MVTQPVQKQFMEDHDWFRMGAHDVEIPYRTAFGLPHPYFSMDRDRGPVSAKITPARGSDRRGSPMLFHIHKIGETYFPVVTLLPTQFLPGPVQAVRPAGRASHAYSLGDRYGSRDASGLDVLLDFVGEGPGKFVPNQVMRFERIWPDGGTA